MNSARTNWSAWLVGVALLSSTTAVAHHYMDLLGDSFWYVATGSWILDHRALPHEDPFCFTTRGVPWTVHMPLAQIAFALLVRVGGLNFLLWCMAALLGATLTGAVLVATRRVAARALLGVIALWVPFFLRADLAARGQIFGDAAFVVLLVLVRRIERTKRVSPAVLVAFGSLYLQLHSSALLAPIIFTGYAVSYLVSAEPSRDTVRRMAVSALCTSAGMLATLAGPGLLVDVLRLTTLSSTASIDLFRPPHFRDWEVISCIGACLAVAVFALPRRSSRRAGEKLRMSLVVAGFTVAGFFGRRYLELAMLAALVAAGPLFEKWVRFVEVRAIQKRGERTQRRTSASAWLAMAHASAGLLLLGAEARDAKDPLAQVPSDAMDAITSGGGQATVINPYHWGGYVEYRLGPTRRTFVDGRNQLFENGVFEDHRRLDRLEEGWNDVLEAYDPGFIVWEKGAPLDAALRLHPKWELRFSGRLAVVYARRR